jgi:hypothetical protein
MFKACQTSVSIASLVLRIHPPGRVPCPALVRGRVVDPGASFHVCVTFPSGVAQMKGEIRIEKLVDRRPARMTRRVGRVRTRRRRVRLRRYYLVV